MFYNGDIIVITDAKEHIFDLQGVVLGHNHITDEVAYKIVANGYKGLAVHTTKARNCTLLERNANRQFKNDR